MKKLFKRFLLLLLLAFIVIQFFRPVKNRSEGPFPNDISTAYDVPPPVLSVLQVACYDCHSDNTRYPWYAEVQPFAWWHDSHVRNGKKHLNFSKFTTYKIGRQFEKFEEARELLDDGVMPLPSYTWLHNDAKLSAEEKKLISDWTIRLQDSMRARYPPDSLLKAK